MLTLGTVGAIYKDYDSGYTLEMLRDKYNISLGKALDILATRISMSKLY